MRWPPAVSPTPPHPTPHTHRVRVFTPRPHTRTSPPATPPRRSKDALAGALGSEFELVQEAELPYVLRQGERCYQLHAAHATLWRRVA